MKKSLQLIREITKEIKRIKDIPKNRRNFIVLEHLENLKQQEIEFIAPFVASLTDDLKAFVEEYYIKAKSLAGESGFEANRKAVERMAEGWRGNL